MNTHVLRSATDGHTASFYRTDHDQWGMRVRAGKVELVQEHPVQVEVFRRLGDVGHLERGYDKVSPENGAAVGWATIDLGPDAVLQVQDRWCFVGEVLTVDRKASVSGTMPGGFLSAIRFELDQDGQQDDIQYFVPGIIYGHRPEKCDLDRIRGCQNASFAGFEYREDSLSAPLAAMLLGNGASLAMLDPSPQGNTSVEEVGPKQASVMIDEQYRFGALGVRTTKPGRLEIGFWLPGSVGACGRLPERRRYSRIVDGVAHSYTLRFRFAQQETYRDLVRNSWRWAYRALDPRLTTVDPDAVRVALIDQLASTVDTVDGRTGISWIYSAFSGRRWARPDDTRCAMGFCGKNLEAAGELLREADRCSEERGQELRGLGIAIIDSFVRQVSMSPPAGDGFDLLTGEITISIPPSPWRPTEPARVFLRMFTEDLWMLLKTYRREKALGREHEAWLQWCRSFADWLLAQQRDNGSLPRSWDPKTAQIVEDTGSTTYNAVPFWVLLFQLTGEAQYFDAAKRAADYTWDVFGRNGVFVGGTIRDPRVVDKEAGMLALEALLALYEETGEPCWLERACVAADFAETWMWVWDVPMPEDARDGELRWKRGVSTIGVQGITAGPGGGVDQCLAWSAPSFAKLYKLTHDPHYLSVSRLLLHCTKAMLELPGKCLDLAGPGWQQEHFALGMNRGIGGHGGWLPWVTVNHLHSITGFEECECLLFEAVANLEGAPDE